MALKLLSVNPTCLQSNTTSCRWIVQATPLHPPHAPPVAYARFQQPIWYLYASQATQQTVTPLQRLRLHRYFLHHAHSFSALWRPHPHREFLNKAYTRGMRQALDARVLGRWAQLLQDHIVYLPYETHPVIRMLPAISLTHTHPHTCWSAMPERPILQPHNGYKNMSLQQLRVQGTPHSTISYGTLPNSTGPWSLVPVELVGNEQFACYREPSWWHVVHRWALNDTAPALPSETTAIPAAQHTKQLQTTLRQAHKSTHEQRLCTSNDTQQRHRTYRLTTQHTTVQTGQRNSTIPHVLPADLRTKHHQDYDTVYTPIVMGAASHTGPYPRCCFRTIERPAGLRRAHEQTR